MRQPKNLPDILTAKPVPNVVALQWRGKLSSPPSQIASGLAALYDVAFAFFEHLGRHFPPEALSVLQERVHHRGTAQIEIDHAGTFIMRQLRSRSPITNGVFCPVPIHHVFG